MSKASDELRKFVDNSDLSAYTEATLYGIANRIDAEMVELPRDANNETIHLGDKTYDCNGSKQAAISFQLYGEENPTWMVNCPDGHVAPYNLTHKRPDSWESIADELDEWCDGADADTTTFDVPRDLADRIRKLAKKEDK